ncbi:MAG TPA: hypothetical protein VKF40_20220 [Burkholderiales bacterium]|nr:hypothetical protein [Burkholderiales bacterium]
MMQFSSKFRLRIEVGLGIACALLAALTAAVPDWFEVLFAFEPDKGSGEAEWLLVTALAVVAVVCGILARAEWRRLRTG